VSLSLDKNSITGSIPSELGLLSKLESLLLSNNDMEGSIPEELSANLTRLRQFGVGGNLIDLDGPIPMWLLKPSMTFLDLYECGIGGSLPSQLGLMTDLRELHLNVNFLRGTFPTEIGLLTKLQVLELSINSIEGTLPAQLSSCISLTKLYLYENLLEGTIPNDALGRLSHLRIVDISGTGLSGSIPASEDSGLCGLRSSVNLSELVVDCSGVSQVVCDCCTECSRKKKGYVATLCCD
jgi:Leucine-rich repeat (LRR) protein